MPHTRAAAALRWYLDAGVDEAIGEMPVDRYAAFAAATPPQRATQPAPTPATAAAKPPPRPAVATPALSDSPRRAAESAAALAAGCRSLAELRRAVETFDGCPLKVTASTTVFADGAENARVMVIGEAPGAEEDRQGLPFVGASGRLLDRMLASIGLDRRGNAYITNVVYWRPPGNRKPTQAEVAVLVPFLARHIALINPEAILLLGGLAASTVFGRGEGIMRLRGQWADTSALGLPHPIPAIATFHPAFLLRSAAQKRLAWRDLLLLRRKVDSLCPRPSSSPYDGSDVTPLPPSG